MGSDPNQWRSLVSMALPRRLACFPTISIPRSTVDGCWRQSADHQPRHSDRILLPLADDQPVVDGLLLPV